MNSIEQPCKRNRDYLVAEEDGPKGSPWESPQLSGLLLDGHDIDKGRIVSYLILDSLNLVIVSFAMSSTFPSIWFSTSRLSDICHLSVYSPITYIKISRGISQYEKIVCVESGVYRDLQTKYSFCSAVFTWFILLEESGIDY